MTIQPEIKLLNRWQKEILHSLGEKDFWGVAIFSTSNKLLFANASILKMLENFSHEKLLNPSFEKLCALSHDESSLIFEGYLTLGSYSQVNVSLPARIFRKSDEILILTGSDAANLLKQNKTLHQLNREINNLQRQLINEKRNLENILHQLDEKNRELQKSNRQKDKLFSVIAHDLKSPFSGLLGFAEILNDNYYELESGQRKEFIHSIFKSANNTYNLIETLLEWASLQREAVRLNLVTFNVNQHLKEVVEQIQEKALEKNITVQVKIADHTEWKADINMLTSILRNLLTNAIKFSFNNSKIIVSVRTVSNELEFSVTDYGTGMREEKVKKLFVNEFNESTRGTGDEKGSGLGLAICKDFVEMHEGRIWAESISGKGTTVIFTLPLPPNR